MSSPEPTPPKRIGTGVILIPTSLKGIWMSQRIGDVPYKGYWQVPGGSKDDNETILEAAIRETREETGIVLLPENLVISFEGGPFNNGLTDYDSVVYSTVTAEVPKHLEPHKCTPWEIVPWVVIPTLQTFSSIHDLFN